MLLLLLLLLVDGKSGFLPWAYHPMYVYPCAIICKGCCDGSVPSKKSFNLYFYVIGIVHAVLEGHL